VELSNGCICCTVADDFIPALKRLIDHPDPARAHRHRDLRAGASQAAGGRRSNWPEIALRVTVDGVVAVVDGAGRCRRDGSQTIRRPSAASGAQDASLDHDNPLEEVYEDQLLCADLIVLNKADLMSAEETGQGWSARSEAWFPERSRLSRWRNGRVSPKVLLGLGGRRRT